jgi:hypothetical protein
MTEYLILVAETIPDLATRHNEDGSPIDATHFVLHTQMAACSDSQAMAEAKRISSVLEVAVLLTKGTVTLVTPDEEVTRG